MKRTSCGPEAEQIVEPGTFAIGGHVEIGCWIYDAATLERLDG